MSDETGMPTIAAVQAVVTDPSAAASGLATGANATTLARAAGVPTEQLAQAQGAIGIAGELQSGTLSAGSVGTLAQAAGVSTEQIAQAQTAMALASDLQSGSLSAGSVSSLAQAAGVSPQALAAAQTAQSLLGNFSGSGSGAGAVSSVAQAVPSYGAMQLAGANSYVAPAQTIAAGTSAAATAFAQPGAVDFSEHSAAGDLSAAVAAVSPFEDSARLFRLYTLLPEDKRLYLETLHGVEQLSAPFRFELRLVSRNAAIELKELISGPVTVGIVQTDGSERYINGYVSSFAFERNDSGWAGYRATLVPWTHFLTLRQDSRIFQKESIPKIVEKIFGEYGATADYEWRLQRSYEPWDFIVQYQESDYHFVSRLIEREGWSYFYEWSPAGHKLIITDDTPNQGYCPPLPLYPEIEFNGGNRTTKLNSVSDFQAVRELQPGKVTVDTYDYQAPRGLRLAEVPTVADQGSAPKLEIFDGTPGFAYRNRAEGERYARQRMEGYEARAKFFHGATDCPDFTIGRTIALKEHHWFDDPETHRMLLLRVEHFGRNNIRPDDPSEYSAQFVCQRRSVPYRPEATHAKPSIAGLQTATVTGPPGEEIWTNKSGCIKVRFHWDRRAKFDATSSCWIRVSQPWAGEGWGTIAIPRVGQEVVVGFMEGDPDRPMVLGSVYNADQPAPYGLPAGGHMMGFKSNSTPGGGGYSEMVIHDTKGKELVNIHAQKDMVATVLNNQSTTVKGPKQTIDVTTGKQATTVKQEITITSTDNKIDITAATSITLTVGQSKLEMKSDGTINIIGVKITSTASSDHVVIGKNLHLNP